MTKEELKSLLSLSRFPCEKACEWAADRNPDKLELVAAAKYDWRRWVAIFTCDPEVLAMLAADPHWLVRGSVSKNACTPAEKLATMATDSYHATREDVAGNHNTPADTLAILATDPHWAVRYAVAENPKTPPGILAILATDQDPDVRDIATYHLNTSAEATI